MLEFAVEMAGQLNDMADRGEEPTRAAMTRKVAYELQHPETALGAIGGGHEQSRQIGDSGKADRFTADPLHSRRLLLRWGSQNLRHWNPIGCSKHLLSRRTALSPRVAQDPVAPRAIAPGFLPVLRPD